MRKLLWILMLLGAVWLGPRFVDWGRANLLLFIGIGSALLIIILLLWGWAIFRNKD